MKTNLTPMTPPPDTPTAATGFARRKDRNIVHELLAFLWTNRLWWMVPIILVMAILLGLMALAIYSGAAAPFIYTLW